MASMYYQILSEPPTINPIVLRQIFGLSPQEANVAVLIASGLSLAEIQTTMHLSRETIRNMLKKVFWKTDTHRQAELAVLLLQTVN